MLVIFILLLVYQRFHNSQRSEDLEQLYEARFELAAAKADAASARNQADAASARNQVDQLAQLVANYEHKLGLK
jgi:hypothetical protein